MAIAMPPVRTSRPARRAWRGPQYPGDFPTLGWGVLDWITDNLPSPSDSSQPFVLTDEQARIVLRWYELDPDTGEFVYRRGRSERSKGWGKSPLLAAIALAEFAGPVRFGGWDDAGEPIGVAWTRPVVEIAAVSEDQTDNTYAVLYEMLRANDSRAAKRLGIDAGRTRLYLADRPGDLRPVTASSASREGARLTFAVLDETHLWLRSNGGVKLAGTLRRNAAKMGGRTFETTNAPILGEKSVAEASGHDAEPGVLHDVVRPDDDPMPDWSDDQMRTALRKVYGDSWWAKPDRIIHEIRDPATPWDDALRFWFNVRSAGVTRAIDPRVWDARVLAREVERGTRIALGFDGSISQDATVLRGCTEDGHSFIVGAWLRPRDAGPDWQVPRAAVHEAVAAAFERYTVGRMLCDPPKWWTEIQGWADRYGADVVLAFDTNRASMFAPAVDRWRTALAEGTHTHDGDPVTSDHVKAAHLKKVHLTSADDDGRTRYVLVKGEDRRKIDAAVADVLAFEAAMTMPPVVPDIIPQAFTL